MYYILQNIIAMIRASDQNLLSNYILCILLFCADGVESRRSGSNQGRPLINPEMLVSSPELGGMPHQHVRQQPEPDDHARKYCDVLPDIHIRKPIHTYISNIREADGCGSRRC